MLKPTPRNQISVSGEQWNLSGWGPLSHVKSRESHCSSVKINHLLSSQLFQCTIIVPKKLVENNSKDTVSQLVKAGWTEQLLEVQLCQPANSPSILLHYYTERLMETRYHRAQLELKLYGDVIAKDGLPLIDLGPLSFV